MILNITFTHPEKIYKGNKTVTNSEGNAVRLSRQKWMNVCSWRNALQSCCRRAGGSPPALGTTPSGLSWLSPWCPPSLFSNQTEYSLHGTAVPKRRPRPLLCATAAPTTCLEPNRLRLAALGPSSVAGNFQKGTMRRREIQISNLSSALYGYCSFNT